MSTLDNSPIDPLFNPKDAPLPSTKTPAFGDQSAADNQYQTGISSGGGGIDTSTSPIEPAKGK